MRLRACLAAAAALVLAACSAEPATAPRPSPSVSLPSPPSAAAPGDVRDMSTPRAFATNLRAYAVGDALGADDRAVLVGWLRGNTTGDTLIRAAVPAGWQVGDKTGAGGYGTRNDIAVLWPPGGPPIVLTIMSTRGERDARADDALVAQAAVLAIEALER